MWLWELARSRFLRQASRLETQAGLFFVCLFFNRRIIAFPWCVSFCSTSISFMYTFISSPLTLPPPPYPTTWGHHRAPGWAPCITQQLPTYPLHSWWCIYTHQCHSLSLSHPLLPLLWPWVHSLHLHLCSCQADLNATIWKENFFFRKPQFCF